MSDMFKTSFGALFLQHWNNMQEARKSVTVSGSTITIADVVAAATYGSTTSITPSTLETVAKCWDVFDEKVSKGEIIYGVNTGFGGSADQRTDNISELQQNLFHLLLAGVIDEAITTGGRARSDGHADDDRVDSGIEDNLDGKLEAAVPDISDMDSASRSSTTVMPEIWVRAAMLVRLQSLALGASGVRPEIVNSLVNLLNANIVPVTPLRGSISASGDLQPLAYLGALMQGKPFVAAYCGNRKSGRRRLTKSADVALRDAGISPVEIRAKEGLAIVNGTAVSAGVAALVLHESLTLLALSQLTTAMTVEALGGSPESFHPFLSRMRPHVGQTETAASILSLLEGSRLTLPEDSPDTGKLRQDRYSTRTAPQWIGPIMEDFQLSYHQILTEINSVTDNPLIDPSTKTVVHGGNFQAKSVTSAVEKLRLGLQSLGRLSFSQVTELINPATNNGLPANLTADDPSKSFIFKGADIMAAALTSELGFLANSAGSHVQTAEMGNQAVNSLALISARYTNEAVDVLSQLLAVQIVALCQALELRVRLQFGAAVDEVGAVAEYLGRGSSKMYGFVRGELGVPLLTEEIVSGLHSKGMSEGVAPSVGSNVSKVYKAIRSGRIAQVLVGSMGNQKIG